MGSKDADFGLLKTMRSHAAAARFSAELPEEPCGWVLKPENIHSPYASGPVRPVFAWRDHYVLFVETAHKVYQAFSVAPRLVHGTEDAAYDHLKVCGR
jgi:hypothetical protein